MTPEHVTTTLTDCIYRSLFGKSRAELLAIAKMLPHYGDAAGVLYPASDEDECMRDCFNIEALQALSKVESRAAQHINLFDFKRMTEQQGAEVLANIVLGVCKVVAKNGTINPFEGDK